MIAVAGGMCYLDAAPKKGRRNQDTKEDCKTMHTALTKALSILAQL